RTPPASTRFPYTTLFRSLVFRTEHMAIVLREAAHTHHAVKGARRLIAMALPEFAVPQRQIAVRVQVRIENLHVSRAVHRLERVRSEEHTSELQSRENLVC